VKKFKTTTEDSSKDHYLGSISLLLLGCMSVISLTSLTTGRGGYQTKASGRATLTNWIRMGRGLTHFLGWEFELFGFIWLL